MQVQSFGLILSLEETSTSPILKTTKSSKRTLSSLLPPSRDFTPSLYWDLTTDYLRNIHSFWLLVNHKIRLKEKMMALAYKHNIVFIYFLHLTKFLSLECVFQKCENNILTLIST